MVQPLHSWFFEQKLSKLNFPSYQNYNDFNKFKKISIFTERLLTSLALFWSISVSVLREQLFHDWTHFSIGYFWVWMQRQNRTNQSKCYRPKILYQYNPARGRLKNILRLEWMSAIFYQIEQKWQLKKFNTQR